MSLLRRQLGAALRRHRERQRRTLRQVASSAGVSLGYLSEVERGVKEASSELLSAICRALDVRLPDLLVEVADALYRLERTGVGLADALPATVPVSAPLSSVETVAAA
jgi:transcriptional regulator with XRE-family HTH domain